MSLTGRFTALLLATLGLVLVGFSAALFVAARIYLHRLVDERLGAALSVLAAAAEVHPGDVEWEPTERVLHLGRESGADRLVWMVFDDRGQLVDHSSNLGAPDMFPGGRPRPDGAAMPPEIADRRGGRWQVAQRRIVPSAAPPSGSRAAADRRATAAEPGLPPLAAEGLPDGHFPALVVTACAPLGPMQAALATLGWTLAALAVAIGGTTALLCRRLSRTALTPLTRMAESARGLDATDAGWSLEAAGTGDELEELGRAFNELLARLHVAYERQRRFSADASHQLRTPLTVLIGQIEVALRRERPAEEYRRVLAAALARAVQLTQIVEALLFLGRAEGDADLPGCAELDLGRWTAGYLSDRPASGRGAEVLHGARAGDGPRIRANPQLLGQALENLLDNATKHGGPGKPVLVETLRDGEEAVLAVEDRGPGLPDEELARVFEPFYRSARARRAGIPGVGLGLAVVRRIAHALDGSVRARYESGRGCRFEVRLPAIDPLQGPARPAAAGQPEQAAAESRRPWTGGRTASRR